MKPTEKQMEFIRLIESYISYYGIEFTGNTKEEARAFINDNIDFFKEEQYRQDTMTQIEYEEYGFL